MATLEAAIGDAVTEQAGLLVDTAEIPGGGELRLLRHGPHYEIMFGHEQLMGSWSFRSEQALATLTLDGLGERPRVLIGGLGMGFTLAAARAALPTGASIVVAELVPKIVTWAGDHLRHLFGSSLEDPRVSIEVRDVHDLIVGQAGGFDAILLDVDNGPDGLISLANERLYSAWGLRAARAALRPGGVLAIWSAFPDHGFSHQLRASGFDVEEFTIDTDRSEDNPDHTIWLATVDRSGDSSSGIAAARGELRHDEAHGIAVPLIRHVDGELHGQPSPVRDVGRSAGGGERPHADDRGSHFQPALWQLAGATQDGGGKD